MRAPRFAGEFYCYPVSCCQRCPASSLVASMAAFVAAAGSLGRSLAAGQASSSHSGAHDIGSFIFLNGNHGYCLQAEIRFSVGGWTDRYRLKIVARAGGYRPPGTRRPFTENRQLLNVDESSRDRIPVNEEIKASTVLLIGKDGKLVGTISKQAALDLAQDQDLDLVQIDKQNPPCVKILDYSKFKYELQKKKREQQKKSLANRVDLKELKMRYNIDTHDYGVRLKSAQRFLRDGDKVKLIVQFKGREAEFKDLGEKLFERFQHDLKEDAFVESKIVKDGKNIWMVLAPVKEKGLEKMKAEDDTGAIAMDAEA